MAESSGQTFAALLRGFTELPPQRKLGLMVALAAVIALFVGSMMWAQTPDYRVLYGNLADRDGGAVIDALQKQNIPYKTGDGGTIMVPSSMVYEARLKLASQGLPKGGAAGFELMDNQKFGLTQFQENVNYQRALEGEITRTIETISSVQGARVHLAIPKQTVFVREEQKPSASVLVNLYAGRTLDKAQVAGIVHLIAGSVPEMPPENVNIIDQNGKMLTSVNGKGSLLGLDSSQLEFLREVEQSYVKRIQDILSPILGAENIRAQVAADLDFSLTEQTAETYKPNPTPDVASIRSQQTSETMGGGGNAAGVPGALSNQPPGAATAPINAPGGRPAAGAANAAAAGSTVQKDTTTNYELDKTISHVKRPVGSIKRLSVAVVVNNKGEKDKKGKVNYRPLTKDELAQVYNLSREAMGFTQARGDTLNVVNAPFNMEVGEEAPSLPFWKDPALQSLAREIVKYLLIAGLLMYLVLKVLKPMVSELTAIGHARAESRGRPETAGGEAGEFEGEVGDVVSIGAKKPHSYEEDLKLVKDMAKNDPKIVANVVKEWVNKE